MNIHPKFQSALNKLSEPAKSLVLGFTLLCIIHDYSFKGISQPSVLIFTLDEFPPSLIASFGASAVLIYGAYSSPLSQPKNLILGHLIGALIGFTIKQIFYYAKSDLLWLQGTLAVSLSIFIMELIDAVHPPGYPHVLYQEPQLSLRLLETKTLLD